MTSKPLRHRKQKGRTNARPLQQTAENETGASDELDESLIETFPASDPPAWVALARVGTPKRKTDCTPRAKATISLIGTIFMARLQIVRRTGKRFLRRAALHRAASQIGVANFGRQVSNSYGLPRT
jgi:hypothetical protein